jgi:hypothetical protein
MPIDLSYRTELVTHSKQETAQSNPSRDKGARKEMMRDKTGDRALGRMEESQGEGVSAVRYPMASEILFTLHPLPTRIMSVLGTGGSCL